MIGKLRVFIYLLLFLCFDYSLVLLFVDAFRWVFLSGHLFQWALVVLLHINVISYVIKRGFLYLGLRSSASLDGSIVYFVRIVLGIR